MTIITDVPQTGPIEGATRGGMTSIVPAWMSWFKQVYLCSFSVQDSGTTTQRPTKNLWKGRRYFDTTIDQPVWYDGTTWVTYSGGGGFTAINLFYDRLFSQSSGATVIFDNAVQTDLSGYDNTTGIYTASGAQLVGVTSEVRVSNSTGGPVTNTMQIILNNSIPLFEHRVTIANGTDDRFMLNLNSYKLANNDNLRITLTGGATFSANYFVTNPGGVPPSLYITRFA